MGGLSGFWCALGFGVVDERGLQIADPSDDRREILRDATPEFSATLGDFQQFRPSSIDL